MSCFLTISHESNPDPWEPVVPELHEGLNAQVREKKISSETFGQIRRITLNRAKLDWNICLVYAAKYT